MAGIALWRYFMYLIARSSWLGSENLLAIVTPLPHAATAQLPSLGTTVLDGPCGDLLAALVISLEDFQLAPIAKRNF
ncbi:hypothetical protein F441_10825 [Phytophthora nicotianae CJ01A1]|uniref:Secreted protein n=3 Tax=Phytophthora nicotianae TaxID=4792 RepID=W2IUK2_PHYNI|nr:hypothetical protein L915_10635 [Phytophthora nicotianae]ETL37835.1 hypothetical protein L916_10525 [Phytophthora nicotianae]ETO73072.1 hypothetical protein F444_10957 [Phytophthora nicotianae P1976]ETP14235.1 hypothetical protein F441_10825 [Phytophthora nicotianae CJ01A1]